MWKFFKKYGRDFLSLFFPRLCYACGNSLLANENILCTDCRFSLPETGFHTMPDNPVEKLFWGRLFIERAAALLFFDKGSKYQHLLHELKYGGKKEIGTFLGELLGSRIKEICADVDIIVPVPLHPVKLRRRGYNQSEVIAEGISSIIGKPIVTKGLKRKVLNPTQTHKNRFERWQNVEDIFVCKFPELLKNKHVLLVDDIVTTGSTLEAAGMEILKIENTRLSIITAAYANI